MRKHSAIYLVLILLISSFAVGAKQTDEDEQLALTASNLIGKNYLYTMFDYIEVEAREGIIYLSGSVTEPRKARDYVLEIREKLGDTVQIVDKVNVLPASFSDDRIRLAIKKRIFSDGGLLPYSFQRFPAPVHVIVANGRVTLEGSVHAKMDKMIIESKARSLFGVLSVENNLQFD